MRPRYIAILILCIIVAFALVAALTAFAVVFTFALKCAFWGLVLGGLLYLYVVHVRKRKE